MAKNTVESGRLIIPAASWPTVKKVIRGYGAATSEDPSGEDIAGLSGLQRTVISGCNKFLRAANIVQSDKNLLTEVGRRLVTAWDIENHPMAVEALQEIIMSSAPLAQLVGVVRARGSINAELFKGQVIAAAGLKGGSFMLAYVKTIVDILDESKLIQITDDGIGPGRSSNGAGAQRRAQDNPTGGSSPAPPRSTSDDRRAEYDDEKRTRTPIPFGPSRLGYIELPGDWDNKELPKLLRMLELIFGGES